MERHYVTNEKGTVDISYYIHSLLPNYELLGHCIRQHWWAEYQQNHVLFVVFKRVIHVSL